MARFVREPGYFMNTQWLSVDHNGLDCVTGVLKVGKYLIYFYSLL